MTVPWEILVLSATIEDRRTLAHMLGAHGLDPICCSTLHEAVEAFQKHSVGLAFCDKTLPDGSYRDLIAAARDLETRPRVVVTSHHADWDEYLEAMRLGAFDVIAVPGRPTDVEWMVILAKRYERPHSRPEPFVVPLRGAAAS